MSDTDSKQAMSVPAAIVIAGIVIAGAVYFSQVGPKVIPATPTVDPSVALPSRPASLAIREVTSEDHVRGPENAKITIVEYSDFDCPFCKVFHQSMLQVLETYPNDVRWVFRHAPILQLHPNAPAMANASECAAVQGKFWEFTDVVFAEAPGSSGAILSNVELYATKAGIADIEAMQKCIVANEFTKKVQADLEDGMQAGSKQFGTPFNMVITKDGEKKQLGGGVPFAQLQAIIEPLL